MLLLFLRCIAFCYNPAFVFVIEKEHMLLFIVVILPEKYCVR